MWYTLSDLEIQIEYESQKKEKSWLRKLFGEAKLLGGIFLMIFFSMYLVTNAQLVKDKITDQIDPNQVQTFQTNENNVILNLKSSKERESNINQLVSLYGNVPSLSKDITVSTQELLNQKLDSYNISFNTLPPAQRIIIPSIWIDTPIVWTQVKDYDAFINWDFSSEMEQWIVKYPTSPNPGEWWNTFIFWHSSQEYRKHNKYGTVFRNLPSLSAWDEIQVVWQGKLYTYKIMASEVVSTKKVNDTYQQFSNLKKESITLMTCYPIGTTQKRLMVYAEKV